MNNHRTISALRARDGVRIWARKPDEPESVMAFARLGLRSLHLINLDKVPDVSGIDFPGFITSSTSYRDSLIPIRTDDETDLPSPLLALSTEQLETFWELTDLKKIELFTKEWKYYARPESKKLD